jgi:hypothetical protein
MMKFFASWPAYWRHRKSVRFLMYSGTGAVHGRAIGPIVPTVVARCECHPHLDGHGSTEPEARLDLTRQAEKEWSDKWDKEHRR